MLWLQVTHLTSAHDSQTRVSHMAWSACKEAGNCRSTDRFGRQCPCKAEYCNFSIIFTVSTFAKVWASVFKSEKLPHDRGHCSLITNNASSKHHVIGIDCGYPSACSVLREARDFSSSHREKEGKKRERLQTIWLIPQLFYGFTLPQPHYYCYILPYVIVIFQVFL